MRATRLVVISGLATLQPRSPDWCIFFISESMNRKRTLILFAAAALAFALSTFVFPNGSSAGQKLVIAYKDSTFLNTVSALVFVALILCTLRVFYVLRARSMCRIAARWGFRYIGPTAPPQWWLNPSRPKIPSPLPGWISRLGVSQAWNIIEGKNNGTSVFVFDAVWGGPVRTQPCTYIACQTEQSPFGMSTSVEPVIQIHGWTVLHGVWFFWFSWFMGIGRLDRHLSNLQAE